MTSRQAGRRISAAAKRRESTQRRDSYGKTHKKEALRPSERRSLIRLMVCGSVFVTLVAVKVLLPGRLEAVNGTLSGLLEQNMDVERVFSAVGQTISGERGAEELLQEVYQAVFQPQAVSEDAEKAVAIRLPTPMDCLRRFRTEREPSPQSGPDGEGTTEGEGQTAPQSSDSPYIQYSDQNLPGNVSLEQAVLGFDYVTPVSGTLTSNFGYRDHPIEGEERFHYGIDIAAESGTAVSCFAGGKVTAVGESSSYGKYLIVSHGEDYETLYAHCSKITVSSGTAVEQGQTIAEVGETGLATGPHLHFELHRGKVYLNPIYYVSVR